MSKDDDPPSPSAEVVDFDALNAALGVLPAPGSSGSVVGESRGASSATYASARPHPMPSTLVPRSEDPNTPSIIVDDDTIQTGPPAMGVPTPGPLLVSPSAAATLHAMNAPAPDLSRPFTPQAFQPADPNLTLRMPERPRRPRTPTIVMRSRGPSRSQKLLVFMAMLIVFVAGGIAFLIFYRPPGLNLDGILPR